MANWIRGASATDAGAVREHNEDACLYRDDGDEEGGVAAIAVVADGMGGMSNGGIAADIAVASCAAAFDARIATYAKAWWCAEHVEPRAVEWSAVAAEE